MSLKTFNTAAAAALSILMMGGVAATEAAAPEAQLVHHKNSEMAHFFPDWSAVMDAAACSKDGHVMQAAIKIYVAKNHLETQQQNLKQHGKDPYTVNKMVQNVAGQNLSNMWGALAAGHNATELVEANIRNLKEAPQYTKYLETAINAVHQKTDITIFAELMGTTDTGQNCQPR